MDRQLVVFNVAGELYGVDINRVDAIIKMQAVTKVPKAPGCMQGVTNIRGEVLPLLDLRSRFGLEDREYTRDTRIVVIMHEDLKVGMIVDAVSEVTAIQTENIEPPSPMVTNVAADFIEGIARHAGTLIILIDLGKVLMVEEQLPV